MPDTGVQTLAERGKVAERLPGYEVRPQQIEMAESVAAAFRAGEHLLVEAGTGVGKSFAYLVPAIEHVIKMGGRVVVSTHTIALQEQLINKDIPFLRSVFGDGFSAVLVKGRSNYLGIRRLIRASANQAHLFNGEAEVEELEQIQKWSYTTRDGSLADLAIEPRAAVWERVKSDGDDCLGRKCPHFQKCFYQQARRNASEAQLLIVNHALLFSDLALRQSGASILPDYDYVILDEAHTVESVAGDHLGIGATNLQVRFLLNTLWHERSGRGVLKTVPGMGPRKAVEQARAAQEKYFGELAAWHASRNGWNGRLREPPPIEQRLSPELLALADELRAVRKQAKNEEDKSEFSAVMERCSSLAQGVEAWHSQKHSNWVYWMDVAAVRSQRMALAARPLDVGPFLKEWLFDKTKSVVLTSATLVTEKEAPFDYIRRRLSLAKCKCVALGSPFDYRRQLTVHVEGGLPDPGQTGEFTRAACEAIKKYVQMSAGRAFVLFTSYDMLNKAAEALAEFFRSKEMTLLVQGAGLPRSRMLDAFRTTPRCVLFGADTFWAGVDVPGEALSNVIIVKLPFASPTSPVVEARIEQIRERGGNPFMEFQVPEAVLRFKQGVGRLIRTKSDTGIVVILDPRVRTKPYGRRFLEALPECNVQAGSAKPSRTH